MSVRKNYKAIDMSSDDRHFSSFGRRNAEGSLSVPRLAVNWWMKNSLSTVN